MLRFGVVRTAQLRRSVGYAPLLCALLCASGCGRLGYASVDPDSSANGEGDGGGPAVTDSPGGTSDAGSAGDASIDASGQPPTDAGADGGEDPPSPSCGDGLLQAGEQCDDGDTAPGDGCSAACAVEQLSACAGEPSVCTTRNCGNGVVEGDEACDAGQRNGVYFGDGTGCTDFCSFEPNCRVDGVDGCVSACGDGMRIAPEACDDGNASDGDGCSSTCAVESGFTCNTETVSDALPCSYDSQRQCIVLPVIYRDFIAAGYPGGHDDMFVTGNQRSDGSTVVGGLLGLCQSMVDGSLDDQGKPRLRSDYAGCAELGGAPSIFSSATFGQWYDNAHPEQTTYLRTLELEQVNSSSSYQFSSDAHFPLDGLTMNGEIEYCEQHNVTDRQPLGPDPCSGVHNFHFTSEVRTVFRYQGGEVLDFRGDDDVFVFVNGNKAVDLGGVHNPESGSVNLDSQGLTPGNIYEIVVFHAERNPVGSNYRLTLSGFEIERTTGCTPE